MDGYKDSTKMKYMGGGMVDGYAKGGSVKGAAKVGKVMGEFKAGKLHSGSKSGPTVTNPKQATAIAMSEARKAGANMPMKKANGGPVNNRLPPIGDSVDSGNRVSKMEAKEERAMSRRVPGAGAMSEREMRQVKKSVPVASRLPLIGASVDSGNRMSRMDAADRAAVLRTTPRAKGGAMEKKAGGLAVMPKALPKNKGPVRKYAEGGFVAPPVARLPASAEFLRQIPQRMSQERMPQEPVDPGFAIDRPRDPNTPQETENTGLIDIGLIDNRIDGGNFGKPMQPRGYQYRPVDPGFAIDRPRDPMQPRQQPYRPGSGILGALTGSQGMPQTSGRGGIGAALSQPMPVRAAPMPVRAAPTPARAAPTPVRAAPMQRTQPLKDIQRARDMAEMAARLRTPSKAKPGFKNPSSMMLRGPGGQPPAGRYVGDPGFSYGPNKDRYGMPLMTAPEGPPPAGMAPVDPRRAVMYKSGGLAASPKGSKPKC